MFQGSVPGLTYPNPNIEIKLVLSVTETGPDMCSESTRLPIASGRGVSIPGLPKMSLGLLRSGT